MFKFIIFGFVRTYSPRPAAWTPPPGSRWEFPNGLKWRGNCPELWCG